MTDEVTRIVAELRNYAVEHAACDMDYLQLDTLIDGLCTALALALENGGGCICGEEQLGTDTGGKWVCVYDEDCEFCHGSGISDAMRPLLAACGVHHG